MTPSEVYGMLRWTNMMRESISRAFEEFEDRIKGLMEDDE